MAADPSRRDEAGVGRLGMLFAGGCASPDPNKLRLRRLRPCPCSTARTCCGSSASRSASTPRASATCTVSGASFTSTVSFVDRNPHFRLRWVLSSRLSPPPAPILEARWPRSPPHTSGSTPWRMEPTRNRPERASTTEATNSPIRRSAEAAARRVFTFAAAGADGVVLAQSLQRPPIQGRICAGWSATMRSGRSDRMRSAISGTWCSPRWSTPPCCNTWTTAKTPSDISTRIMPASSWSCTRSE